ncbi:MAG: diacylglycerol kinase family lipid kinase [Ruminococcaceae bacterium]|nr:diacylglycerol kinase family lipid kinase [Oscillospiraceae bacterium]
MQKKLLLLVNPVSGKSRVKTELLGILKVFSDADLDPTVYVTRRSGDATEQVVKVGKSYDVIVACGGDGTLNEVVAGALRIRFEGAIGFLPCGTTNDFANSLGIPKNLVKAAELIAEGEAKDLDFGSFNRLRTFIYVAAFGAFTEVSYKTDQKLKNMFGHAAYISEGIAHLTELRKYFVKVECDGEHYEGEYLFGAASNTLSLGGVMKLKAELVDMKDGYHEVLLVKNPKTAGDFAQLSTALLSGKFDNKSIQILRGKKIVFDCDEEIPWCVDGEFAGKFEHAEIHNLHKRLRVFY